MTSDNRVTLTPIETGSGDTPKLSSKLQRPATPSPSAMNRSRAPRQQLTQQRLARADSSHVSLRTAEFDLVERVVAQRANDSPSINCSTSSPCFTARQYQHPSEP